MKAVITNLPGVRRGDVILKGPSHDLHPASRPINRIDIPGKMCWDIDGTCYVIETDTVLVGR